MARVEAGDVVIDRAGFLALPGEIAAAAAGRGARLGGFGGIWPARRAGAGAAGGGVPMDAGRTLQAAGCCVARASLRVTREAQAVRGRSRSAGACRGTGAGR